MVSNISSSSPSPECTVFSGSSGASIGSSSVNDRTTNRSYNRHEKYFLGDDRIYFGVQEKVFLVPTRWLKKNSPRIKKMLKKSAMVDNSEERPLIISDVTVAQFEVLNRFIEHSTSDGPTMSTASWIDLLAACYYLEIASIKPHAMTMVFLKTPAMPIKQLALYEAYAVDRAYLKRAVQQLVVRIQPLTADEMAHMSHPLLARIVEMREAFFRSQTRMFGNFLAANMANALTDSWVANG